MTLPKHGVVVLAAGSSRRFGRTKQLLRLDGEFLVHRAARMALATSPRDAVLVLGHAAVEVAEAVRDLALRNVVCEAHAQGMGASLAAGLAALDGHCEAALVLLCDQPALQAEHLRALLATWQDSPAQAVASAYAGVRGVPAVLPRAWFARVQSGNDEGARTWLRDDAQDVVTVTCEALAHDIDVPGDVGAV